MVFFGLVGLDLSGLERLRALFRAAAQFSGLLSGMPPGLLEDICGSMASNISQFVRVFTIEDGQPPRRRVRRLLFVPGSLGNWGCFQHQAECMLEARANNKAPYPLVQSFMSFPQARANPIFPRCHSNPPYLAFECTDFQDVRTDSIGKSEGLADVML